VFLDKVYASRFRTRLGFVEVKCGTMGLTTIPRREHEEMTPVVQYWDGETLCQLEHLRLYKAQLL